jgi:transcriptional regulator with XRE-family HTH domain
MTLHSLLAALKLSQSELARELGVSRSTVTRWAQDMNGLSSDNIAKLTELARGRVTAEQLVAMSRDARRRRGRRAA